MDQPRANVKIRKFENEIQDVLKMRCEGFGQKGLAEGKTKQGCADLLMWLIKNLQPFTKGWR